MTRIEQKDNRAQVANKTESANSFCAELAIKSNEKTPTQKWFLAERQRMVSENPMSMEQIDRIIHKTNDDLFWGV